MSVLYLVASAKQRENKRGGHFVSRNLSTAVDKAVRVAKRQKRRMYVIVLKDLTKQR